MREGFRKGSSFVPVLGRNKDHLVDFLLTLSLQIIINPQLSTQTTEVQPQSSLAKILGVNLGRVRPWRLKRSDSQLKRGKRLIITSIDNNGNQGNQVG